MKMNFSYDIEIIIQNDSEFFYISKYIYLDIKYFFYISASLYVTLNKNEFFNGFYFIKFKRYKNN